MELLYVYQSTPSYNNDLISNHFFFSGTYKVNLPDGRVQTVTYTADDYGGFVADVKYEGEAVYPPEPAEGYGNSYKPAPKYAPGPPPAKRQ